MAEYINKQALLAEYDRVHVGPPGGARKLIEEAPAADVVPVVRCKDCWNATKMGGFMGKVLYCPIWERNTEEENFCSYGERKEAEGNG